MPIKLTLAFLFSLPLIAQYTPPGNGTSLPASPANSIQFNNAGAFGGMAGSVWDNTARTLQFQDSLSNQIVTFEINPIISNCGVFSTNCDGISPPPLVTSPGNDGNFIELDAINGGRTTITTTGVAGNGGGINFNSGQGAAISTALTSGIAGNGGQIHISAGNGGNCTNGATCVGGDAGFILIGLNAGGTGSTSNGAPGYFEIDGTNAANVFKVTYSGQITAAGLTTTGAATGKKVVCVDTATGILYASSASNSCAN